MGEARRATFAANAAARGLADPAKLAALAAGRATVAHVAAHDLGAAGLRTQGYPAFGPCGPSRGNQAS